MTIGSGPVIEVGRIPKKSLFNSRLIFLVTLQSYVDHGLYDKAILLNTQLESEGLAVGFHEFNALMGHFAESYAIYSSVNSTPYAISETDNTTTVTATNTCPPTPAWSVSEEQVATQQHYHKTLKKCLNEKNYDGALKAYRAMEGTANGKPLNVTESSALIEILVKDDDVREAGELAENMLQRDTYPIPKIFRFLLNKMASSGEVEMMNRIGKFLSPKVKKEVSFDNRLCNAYLSAGKGSDFLDMLEKEVDNVKTDTVQVIKDKFPRGGAMGLLENNPDLIPKYARVAEKYIGLDYIAPMNVLWTYYFINGQHDKAEPLWNKHVKNCPQIMFQKICQTARSEASMDMATRLVDLLQEAKVTSGAQGIAYSCLLDVMTQRQKYGGAMNKLEQGLKRGVKLEDINRTALIRLKKGIETQGEQFPFEIPKKAVGFRERAVTPINDEE